MKEINKREKKEIWKIIEEFSNYEVSNHGRVKSLKYGKERILKPIKNNKGYLYVNLFKNKKPYPKRIHRLVLETFKPNKDLTKTEGNHKDGNKENNYTENLEWCTHSENMKHAYNNGLINNKGKNNSMFGKHHSEETKRKQSEKKKGENHPSAILKEKNVIEIRIDLKEGKLTQKEIGKKFGVSQQIISDIKLRKIWKHIRIKNDIRSR